MRPSSTARWKRQVGILLLSCISLGGAGLSTPGRNLLGSARSFVAYYQALERSGVAGGFWERVLCSLVLASAETRGPQADAGTTTSSS